MATTAPVHVYQIYIRASADQVWQAITDPEFTKRYFHGTAFETPLEPGSGYRMVLPDGSDAVAGTIEEVDPPKKLVMTWRVLYDAAAAEEPPSRVEWHLLEGDDGVTKRDARSTAISGSARSRRQVSRDGWNWVLQSMKSLIETGEPLPGSAPGDSDADAAATTSVETAEAETHRRYGIDANNSTWELLGRDGLTPDEVDDLLGRAYAATYHWRRAARRAPRTPPGVRGWFHGCTPCSGTATSRCTTPTSA